MKPGDIYHARSGKVFMVVPDLAYILNSGNPRCIGCYFNSKEDQTTFFGTFDCVTALEESGIFENEWEHCVGDVIFKEVTDESDENV